jgi:hypothetical protein
LRSTAAIGLGLVVVMALFLCTGSLVRALLPHPILWRAYDPGSNLLALAYRSFVTVVGSYLAARFAPRYPIYHALAIAALALAWSMGNAIVRFTYYDTGQARYPIALGLLALPCAWMGGVLYRRLHKMKEIKL